MPLLAPIIQICLPYSATKAAIVSLAETMRAELDNTGIDVKLISPGF
ncbi:MAG: SDR family NAD(P)-dependent oxidoreductase, partial [Pseudomonadota bacterium]